MEFPFGYPVTDKEGDVNMVYDDSAVAEKWGISDAIRGFPTNFTLQPGQRQVVRLTVRPKQDFRDGMYWSRIRTTSTPQAPAIGEAEDEEITTQITYKFEQVTAVFYKHGEVNTGIEVRDFKTNHSSEDTLSFIVDVERTGNAPFLGSIILNVVDSQGNTIIEKRTSTSIYFDYRQVFEVSKSGLEQKDYSAEIRFISQRPDVPKSDLVQMEPVTRVINFSLK